MVTSYAMLTNFKKFTNRVKFPYFTNFKMSQTLSEVYAASEQSTSKVAAIPANSVL